MEFSKFFRSIRSRVPQYPRKLGWQNQFVQANQLRPVIPTAADHFHYPGWNAVEKRPLIGTDQAPLWYQSLSQSAVAARQRMPRKDRAVHLVAGRNCTPFFQVGGHD